MWIVLPRRHFCAYSAFKQLFLFVWVSVHFLISRYYRIQLGTTSQSKENIAPKFSAKLIKIDTCYCHKVFSYLCKIHFIYFNQTMALSCFNFLKHFRTYFNYLFVHLSKIFSFSYHGWRCNQIINYSNTVTFCDEFLVAAVQLHLYIHFFVFENVTYRRRLIKLYTK